MKKINVVLCLILIIGSFSGCLKNIDVSRLVEEPIVYKAPKVVDWEEKLLVKEIDNQYQGAYIDVTPVFGDKVTIKGMEYAIQMIFEAYNDPNRVINEEPSKRGYKNSIKIYDRQEQLIGSFELSSDFLLYGRADKNASLFLFPEYSYYMIEYALWQKGGSLVLPLEEWVKNDDGEGYKEETLDLRLDHDLKTIIVQKYGLSEAYFTNYEIYTTTDHKAGDEFSIRVYALIGYAGYSMALEEKELLDGEDVDTVEETDPIYQFSRDYHYEKAVRMVYTFVDAKYYRLTEYKEPAENNKDFPSSLESRIRAIFPYEDMSGVMAALDDTSEITLDIHRQALDYLRISGQGSFDIDD